MRWWRRVAGVRRLGVPLPDLLVAASLTAAAVVTTALQRGSAHPWAELIAATACGSLLLRRRAPMAMAVTAAAAIVLLALLPGATTPLWSFVAVLLIAFSAGAHLAGRRAVLGTGLLLVAGYVIQFMTDDDLAERLLTPPVLIGGPVLAGWLLRRSRLQAAALRRLAADLAAEQQRHAAAVALAERNRIARELHDVIAHSVSVMVVQAGAAEQLMADDDPARPHVHAVRSAGREALTELRRSLGLLRQEAGAPPAPQPTLADLPSLVADAGAALTVHGEPPAADPGLQLTVYRIVQEALTNARRHAPGAGVRVCADYRDARAVLVTVEDDGGQPGAGAPLSSGTPGHGLTGMAERAALFGGQMQAGPAGRGWRVVARLPLTPDGNPAEAPMAAVR